nr:MAG TPA: hypothetical protein [Caudoviricetes sp.]
MHLQPQFKDKKSGTVTSTAKFQNQNTHIY